MKAEKLILLVDDIPEYLEMMEALLPDNCRAVKVLSADAAITALTENNFDIAVIDVRLDEKDANNRDGLALLDHVQQKWPELPVIMISAYREFEFQAESLDKGAKEFLKKPIRPDEFIDAVKLVLKEK